MKLNLDFYKNDIKYNELDREQYIINNYISNYDEKEYEKIFEKDNNIDLLYALSDMRKNIISWYPFEKDSSILEIGANLGEITGELCKKASKVVAIEFSKQRGEAISTRHKDKENLEIILGNLKDIKLKEKFDYITLIGVLEYAPIIYQTENSFIDLLKYIKTLLKDNGKILIATSNKFAMRNWSVIDSNEKNLEYDAIINTIEKNKCQLLSKNKLEEMFNEVDIGERKYYYPLPDYKYTNVIFTEDFMPNQNNLHRNMTFYKDTDIVNFHENNSYLQVIREDEKLFKFFANSYFIEIGKNLTDNGIKYISFWNNRKPKYRLKTIIKGDKVYKYPANELAKSHIQTIKNNIDVLNKCNINTLDKYDDEKTISDIASKDAIPYDKLILEEYKKYGIDKVIELINEFKEKILYKLEKTDSKDNVFDNYNIEYTEEQIKDLHFVKKGLWDLNFQNCFVINNELYMYDQEWVDNNVPIEFIIYRGILIFNELKKNIDVDKLYEKLGLLNYKQLFNELEEKISNKIFCNSIVMANHKPMKNVRGMYIENENLKNTNKNIEKELEEEKLRNQDTNKKMQEMQDTINIQLAKINYIESSRGWKLIVKIRNIFSHFKFWKKSK